MQAAWQLVQSNAWWWPLLFQFWLRFFTAQRWIWVAGRCDRKTIGRHMSSGVDEWVNAFVFDFVVVVVVVVVIFSHYLYPCKTILTLWINVFLLKHLAKRAMSTSLRHQQMKSQLRYPVQAIDDHRVILVYKHSHSKSRKKKKSNWLMIKMNRHPSRPMTPNAKNVTNVSKLCFQFCLESLCWYEKLSSWLRPLEMPRSQTQN